ncbi:hypothetical protein Vretifemale_2690 [Volvox reticuliferus]|uniref:Uncharacterized protein n=1 Tax=Volvox reticuliferus TaxID=1737510 RepID=A0A8J4C0U9_9CHLO|nr:hypothetical protein Vretifemale_2690 [Volvox reticuliferus]
MQYGRINSERPNMVLRCCQHVHIVQQRLTTVATALVRTNITTTAELPLPVPLSSPHSLSNSRIALVSPFYLSPRSPGGACLPTCKSPAGHSYLLAATRPKCVSHQSLSYDSHQIPFISPPLAFRRVSRRTTARLRL